MVFFQKGTGLFFPTAMMQDLKGEPIEGDCGALMEKFFLSNFRVGYRRYRGVTLPTRYEAFAERVENMTVRDDDVWVISFPKTGNRACSRQLNSNTLKICQWKIFQAKSRSLLLCNSRVFARAVWFVCP